MAPVALCALVLYVAWFAWRQVTFIRGVNRQADALIESGLPLEDTRWDLGNEGALLWHGIPVEPAYRFSGVPVGWTLGQYVDDGFRQLSVLLRQEARRHDR